MRQLLLAALLLMPAAACANEKHVKENAEKMFADCDANNDGKISKDEYTQKKMNKFDEYDADKDGNLNRDEHQKMAVEMHDKLMGRKEK